MGAASVDERELCARLAGGTGPLTAEMVAVARRHRVHLLLAARLSPAERHTPEGGALVRDLTVAAALHAWQEEVTRELLNSLAASGVCVLLLKGTGLAYTVYPEPHLRPRLDVDLLIRREALNDTEQALAGQGWTRPPERDAELSEPQRHYVKHGPGAVLYHLDVHWKLAIPRVFANALTFDELESGAIHVAPLGASARTLGYLDALFLACLHRVAHHGDALDLLWLWDIHLLMERLSVDERERFIALAERTNMRAICARGLRLAGLLFGTRNAAETAARLETLTVHANQEPSARFLGGIRAITVLGTDLITLPWLDRVHLIADHLIPSTVYMRSRYPGWPRVLLPLAYIARIARGAPKWFRR
jgi:putative nucleotidyltransferase-like protein